jgi:hypothetical protein
MVGPSAPRPLSSGATLVFKVAVPVGYFAYVGVLTWLIYGRGHRPPPLVVTVLLLTVLLGAGAFILWICAPLKRVHLDGTMLLVSNFRREIRVPLASIARVWETRWINIHPVTIELRAPTEFGRRIVFMPRVSWFLRWRSHPVVTELRALAAGTGRPGP